MDCCELLSGVMLSPQLVQLKHAVRFVMHGSDSILLRVKSSYPSPILIDSIVMGEH